ncbi:MAG TPA: Uma2 family endonuclease [Hyphomonadaceae bacterium]|jgi:Uma2 family endonuclease|nr:Uma2 family endonuclease [Hyphomonadaceae bacterium]
MNALVQAHPPFTSDEFYRMADRGAFAGFRVELRRGMILKMSPQHVPHARVKSDLQHALERAIKAAGLGWEVLTEATVSFGGGFEPMADITVFDPALLGGARTIPAAAVKLVVEVSETTLADDLGEKREDYAEGGLAEYWVADVQARTVIPHSQPKDGAYLNEAAPVPISEPLAMLTQPAVSARV